MRDSAALYWKLSAPAVVTLILLLISTLPIGALGGTGLYPLVVLMAIFYWGLFRPEAMPYWLVFALGLIQDVVCSAPLGVSSVVYLLFRMLVARQQRLIGQQVFMATWGAFGVMVLIASAMLWAGWSYVAGSRLPLQPSLAQWGITVVCYPAAHGLFNLLYARLPSVRGAPRRTG